MENEKICLITLPHAGGSSTIFKGWDRRVGCDVFNVDYPGHWTRMKESMIKSFDNLVEDVVSVIEENVSNDYELMIFGHSVGAIMGWQIAPVLISKGYSLRKLFFSGSQNPGSFPEKSIVDATSESDMLKLIGYNSEEYDEAINNQFMKSFFPVLLNDMNVCKSFRCDEHYVNVESIVLYGCDDIFTDLEEMKKWSKYANVSKMIEFKGEHLFLGDKDNIKKIVQLINESL